MINYKFEFQVDNCNTICPYCNCQYQEESESYSEDSRIETCEECGKKFHTYQSFSVDHYTIPDCEINEEQHKWEATSLGDGRTHDFCSICGKCRQKL